MNGKKYQEQTEIPDKKQGVWPNCSWSLSHILLILLCRHRLVSQASVEGQQVNTAHSSHRVHSSATLTVTGFIKTHGFQVMISLS